jgi:hypothetical protein
LLESELVTTQLPPHDVYPEGQTQAPPEHDPGLAQTVLFTQVPALLQVWIWALPWHLVAPGLHSTHPPLRQTDSWVPVHCVQSAPQCSGSLLVLKAQGEAPPQELYGALHWVPHAPPLQVAAPLGGGGHCRQLAPQWLGSLPVV